MTTICAVHEPGVGTWFGSDSMVTKAGTKLFGVKKWVVTKDWAFGSAGDLRATNVLEANVSLGLQTPWDIACWVRGVLCTDGFQPNLDDWGSKSYGQMGIIALPGGVWSVGGDFSLVEIPAYELWAEGSGGRYALGAAHALRQVVGIGPERRLRQALEAASRYDDGTGGEPWVHLLKREGAS